jgi:hypothetical protein
MTALLAVPRSAVLITNHRMTLGRDGPELDLRDLPDRKVLEEMLAGLPESLTLILNDFLGGSTGAFKEVPTPRRHHSDCLEPHSGHLG